MKKYYGLGDIENWSDYRFAWFVDYCAADYVSTLEIKDMAKGLKLDVEGATFLFKDSKSERMKMFEIKDDLDDWRWPWLWMRVGLQAYMLR